MGASARSDFPDFLVSGLFHYFGKSSLNDFLCAPDAIRVNSMQNSIVILTKIEPIKLRKADFDPRVK